MKRAMGWGSASPAPPTPTCTPPPPSHHHWSGDTAPGVGALEDRGLMGNGVGHVGAGMQEEQTKHVKESSEAL